MSSVAIVTGRPPTASAANTPEGLAPERRDALHRMSAVLTHDLNNLLGVIVSATERLAGELSEGCGQRKLALLALEAAERSAELLRRALTLAQDPAVEMAAIDCADTLQVVERLARQAIAPGVRLKVCAPARPLQCRGERTGLEMALLNLCLNAGQATPDGGSVSVQARGTNLSRSDGRRLGLACGAYVVFTVRDTGGGMSPDTLARASQPLFTTKATGTGLGLSSVIDYAIAAGGAFALQSREGHGATATLYLPVPDAAQSAAAA